MNKRRLAKLIVQTVAAAFGLLGLLWMYMGLHFTVVGIRDSDRFSMFFMTPMFILMGGIVLAVAWQTLRHFGPEAIQNMSALIAFFAYTGISKLLEPFQKASKKEIQRFLTEFFIPVLLAYLLYRTLSRKLTEITKAQDTQDQGAEDAAVRRE